MGVLFLWRSGWDSNPRVGVTDKLISSQPRYDHFDTAPYILSPVGETILYIIKNT